MGNEHPDVQSAADLITTLATALRLTAEYAQLPNVEGWSHVDALAAYERWHDKLPGEPGARLDLASMHDVLPATLEATEGWSPSNRDRALGHAVELTIAGQLERTSIVDEATSMLAFLEGATTVTAPPVPFTAATLSDRMGELDDLGLYLWGSDCVGSCSGNATPGSLVCDECNGTRTVPLLGLTEERG